MQGSVLPHLRFLPSTRLRQVAVRLSSVCKPLFRGGGIGTNRANTFVLLSTHRIYEVFLFYHIQHLAQVFVGLPSCHRQVMQEVVAAVAGSLSRHFALEVADEAESFAHQLHNVAALQVALHQEVVTRAASHRAPKNNFIAPYRVIAQEGGGKMLYRVQRSVADSRFAVRLFHTDIESSHYMVAQIIFARDIYSPQQVQVVDGKTRNLFHIVIHYKFSIVLRKMANDCPGAASQKFVYCSQCSFIPGVSLMMRIDTNATPHM